MGKASSAVTGRKTQAPVRRAASRRLERLEAGYRELRSKLERIQRTLDAALAQGALSLSTVDPENLDSVRRFEAARLRDAGRRLRAEMKVLRAAGAIDAAGRRVKRGLPSDMREGTDCDL
jgi:hypothetical protein